MHLLAENFDSVFSGVIAQLVERLLCKQDVSGSSPLTSISLDNGTVAQGDLEGCW